MKKIIFAVLVVLAAVLYFKQCKKECKKPPNGKIEFATITWGKKVWDTTKCEYVCSEQTEKYIPHTKLSRCGPIIKTGCKYSSSSNTIILTEPNGTETFFIFTDGIPLKFQNAECDCIYNDLAEKLPIFNDKKEFAIDVYTQISPNVFSVIPQGEIDAEKGEIEGEEYFKYTEPSVTEDYQNGLEYRGLPDTIYDNSSADVIVPLQKIGGGQFNTEKVWTNNKNVSLTADGGIILSQSQSTEKEQLNYVYYQLKGDRKINRIAIILHRSSSLSQNGDRLALEIKSVLKSDTKPCKEPNLTVIQGGGGSPPNMIVWAP